MDRKESVVIDRGGESSAASGVWATIGVVVLIFLILFLLFGGLNLFTGNQGGTQTDNPSPTPTITEPTTESPAPTTETTPTTESPAPTTPDTTAP